MVAYSFKQRFADRIRAGEKTQTIRAHRKRHAREGERIQLFTGMRTKSCERLIPDPLCLGVDPVRIDLRGLEGCFKGPNDEAEARPLLDRVTIDVSAERLAGDQREVFAILDGFGGQSWTGTGEPMSALYGLVAFWLNEHGPMLFEGVRIRWQHPHRDFLALVVGLMQAEHPAEGSA